MGYTVHGGHKKSDMTEGLGLFFLYDICISYIYIYIWASLVAQTVKRLPTMQETWVRSLDREDPLGKEMATHSSILAARGSSGKELTCQCRRRKRLGLIPESGRCPRGDNGNPLQYSCLENPMDGGAS